MKRQVARVWRKMRCTAGSKASLGRESNPREGGPLPAGSCEQAQSPPPISAQHSAGDVQRRRVRELGKTRRALMEEKRRWSHAELKPSSFAHR